MLVKNEGTRTRALQGGLGLALGLILLGAFLGKRDGRAVTTSAPAPGELHRFLVPARTPGDAPSNRLETVHLELPPDSAARLQLVRDRALERGVIVQEPEDTVPGILVHRGAELPAEIRIKGDWPDHVESDQWSLRVRLEEPLFLGLRVFSIQSLPTVGFLWEWVVLACLRGEDVLAPRASFVNVVINGNPAGIYFLQEHFAKELLEAQGRREGPIVRWDESTHWDVLLQHDLRLPGPAPIRSALVIDTAPVRAFGERRLSSIESLERALEDAVQKMRALRSLAIQARDSAERLRRLEAMDHLAEETIESVLDVTRLARAHAVASLFQVEHSLFWHNMRFYHDPVLERLEPVMFDNMAHLPTGPDPVPLRGEGYVTQFRRSRAYTNGVFRHVARLVEPGYLEAFLATLEPELERFLDALALEDERVAPEQVRAEMRERLLAQRDYLAALVAPAHPANFAGTYELDPDAATLDGTLEIVAWATTRVPVVVEGFRFGNGRLVAARDALGDEEELPTSMTPGPAVILPHDGRSRTFRLPIDARLASLGSVEELKRALRNAAAEAGPLDLAVSVEHRPLAADQVLTSPLLFRRHDPSWFRRGGRPAAPSLEEVLDRHPFLSLDVVTDELRVGPGSWEVEGDLVLPPGRVLRVAAGATLRFHGDAVLLAEGALHLEGTADAPVVLEPVAGAATFCGVVVLGARTRSSWEHAVLRRTTAVNRGGWTVTGGVTFYRSPVTMSDCRFEGSEAEDGLNVVATDVLLQSVHFEDCVSDAFDGDVISGTVESGVFESCGSDGVDLSGSEVRLGGCRFSDLGDKAISIGEGSTVEVDGGLAEDVSIGIAVKDGSRARLSSFGILRARNYPLAIYVKKPAFGVASAEARRLRLDDSGRAAFLVQTGCSLTVDGAPVETEEVDVEGLYAAGVLGR